MPNLTNTIRCLLFILLTSLLPLSFADPCTSWNSQFSEYIELSSSKTDITRAKRLESLLLNSAQRPTQQKLAEVNNFFNEVRWISDLSHWGEKDYWQTPFETLIRFKGDCEDIAIAKYAALRVMGVPEEKLALVYAMRNGLPHMVLTYYESKNADPVVLDDLDSPQISPASKRKDLRPVYGFNNTNLWLTDEHMRQIGSKRLLTPSHKIALLGYQST